MATSSNTCAQTVEFSACSNTANLQIANCSSQVSGAVTSQLYACLCSQNEKLLQCYSYCPDDQQLQLQLTSIQASANGYCQYASSAAQAATAASLTSTDPSLTKTSTVTTSTVNSSSIESVASSIFSSLSSFAESSPSSLTSLGSHPTSSTSPLPTGHPIPVLSAAFDCEEAKFFGFSYSALLLLELFLFGVAVMMMV